MIEGLRSDVDNLVGNATIINGKVIDYPRSFENNEEMRQFYNRYGYVSIKQLVPTCLISEIQRDLIEIFSPFSTDKKYPVDSAITHLDEMDKKKLYELHTAASRSISFCAVSVHLSKIIKQVSGFDGPVLDIASGFLLSIPKDQRLVYDFHQESSYMTGFDNIFNVHFPLFRTATPENGTMSLIPSSHKFGPLEFDRKSFSADSYTNLTPSNIDEITAALPELHCWLELGDCLIFHKDLIHKSNYNNSDFCRPVAVSRFTQSLKGDWVSKN